MVINIHQAIKLVNEAAEMYFVGNAQLSRKLQASEVKTRKITNAFINFVWKIILDSKIY